MSDSILQTAERALIILELLAERPMTATHIQQALDLNKSTVHRLMMTLLSRDFVERNDITGEYQLGLKLVELTSIRLNSIEIRTEATPYMKALATKLNKVVRLAILDEGEAVYIEKAESISSMRAYTHLGKRCPIYCSAIGKSLLMEKSDEAIRELMKDIKLEKFTSNTHESVDSLLNELHDSRKVGYTFDKEEHEIGSFCIAAPIRDYRGDVVAAISISGYEQDVLMKEIEMIENELLSTAGMIAYRLGYIQPV